MALSYKDLNGGLLKRRNKLKEEKLKQLRTVFRVTIKDMLDEISKSAFSLEESIIEKNINKLLYEVKIRINNK